MSSPELAGSSRLQLGLDTPALLQLGLAAAASVAVGLALGLTGGWKVPAALLAVTGLLMLGTVRPAAFLGLFVVLRPMVALISDKQLVHGVASANANGLTGVLLIAVLLVLLATRRLYAPRGTTSFSCILLVSGVAAIYAYATLGGKVGNDPLSEFVRLISMLAIYVLAANLFGSARRAPVMFTLVALSALAPAIFGLVEWISGAPLREHLGLARISSTLGGNSNTMGAYLGTCAVILTAAPLRLPRWVRLPILTVVLITLVGTYSREGWLIFLLGMVVVGWRRKALFGLVAVGAVAVALAVPTVGDRVFPSASQPTRGHQAAGALTSLNWRLQNWNALIGKYAQSPIIGYGLGSVVHVNPYINQYDPSEGWNSHNSLLEILVDGGVVLLIPWLILLATFLRGCARMARTAWELSSLARVALGLWVGVIAAALVAEDLLGTTTVMFVLLVITGTLDGAWREAAARARGARARPPAVGQLAVGRIPSGAPA
jgi:O-antigen ligase